MKYGLLAFGVTLNNIIIYYTVIYYTSHKTILSFSKFVLLKVNQILIPIFVWNRIFSTFFLDATIRTMRSIIIFFTVRLSTDVCYNRTNAQKKNIIRKKKSCPEKSANVCRDGTVDFWILIENVFKTRLTETRLLRYASNNN